MTLFLELWVGNCWIDFFSKCPEPWREMKIKNNEKLVRQWEDSSVQLFLTDFFLSLISGYINIKCLSRNKLLHYAWYGYKSLVPTSEKSLGIQWITSRELHGRSVGCDGAGLRKQRGCSCHAAVLPAAWPTSEILRWSRDLQMFLSSAFEKYWLPGIGICFVCI